MNAMRTQGQRTNDSRTDALEGRTFRSGPYLRQLFGQAEIMDAQLQEGICGRIRQARKEAGFTQQEMADLLGMTMRGYQNYESNRVPFRWLDKIGEITGRSGEWLLRGDQEPAIPSDAELRQMIRLEVEAALAPIEQLLLRLADQAPPGSSSTGS